MRKVICVLLLSLALVLGLFSLAACDVTVGDPSASATGDDATQTIHVGPVNPDGEPAVKNLIRVFDISNPQDIVLVLDTDVESLYQVKIGASIIQPDQYTFANKTLTIPAALMGTDHFLSRKISVKYTQNGDTYSFNYVVADKIIKTCDDFQNINEHLDWYYVLGADLDFQDFGNFNPIGNDGQKHGDNIGLNFTGKLIGAGHTISNLTANADEMTDAEVYTEHDVTVGENEYDTIRPAFGIFMRNHGTIEDVCFKDCLVKNSAGTIMGMVVAVNEGEINNVLVDGGKVIGGAIWLDYNCFVGGFAGMNGAGSINNCISTVTQVKADTMGTLARAFVGKTWGAINNCYACSTGLILADLKTGAIGTQGIIGSDSAPSLSDATGYGFGYRATESGTAMGAFNESYIISKADMTADTTIYGSFDTNYWTITAGEVPSLIVRFTA